jgi:protein-S-isoprenylcysteine O-methyltransferase Ste14
MLEGDLDRRGCISNEQADHAQVIPVPPPLVYVMPLLLGIVLHRRAPRLPLPNWLRLTLGLLLVAVGTAGCGWFLGTLHAANTTYIPDHLATALVVTGPFPYSRNPGYVSMATIYAGIALIANALTAFGILAAILVVLTRGVIEPEEQYLDRRFGESYRD